MSETVLSIQALAIPVSMLDGVCTFRAVFRPRVYSPDVAICHAGDVVGLEGLPAQLLSGHYHLTIEFEGAVAATLRPSLVPLPSASGVWSWLVTPDLAVETLPLDQRAAGLSPMSASPPRTYDRKLVNDVIEGQAAEIQRIARAASMQFSSPYSTLTSFSVDQELHGFYSRVAGGADPSAYVPREADPIGVAVRLFTNFHDIVLGAAPTQSLASPAWQVSEGFEVVPVTTSDEVIDVLDPQEETQALGTIVELPIAPATRVNATVSNRRLAKPVWVRATGGARIRRWGSVSMADSLELARDESLRFVFQDSHWVAFPENAVEFHRLISNWDRYALLSSGSGLVFEFDVPWASMALPSAGPGDARFAVRLHPDNPHAHFVCPWVECECAELAGTKYIGPRPHNGKPAYPIVGPTPTHDPGAEYYRLGMLHLGSASDIQIELDVAMSHILQRAVEAMAASRITVAATDGAMEVPSQVDGRLALEQSVPPLRNIGLEIAMPGLHRSFASAAARAAVFHAAAASHLQDARDRMPVPPCAGENIRLYAEDLQVGYRVDVRPLGDEKWYSLSRRTAALRLPDGREVLSMEDEGSVSLGEATYSDRGGGITAARMSGALFRWDYSFGAPNPLDGRNQLDLPSGCRLEIGAIAESILEKKFGEAIEMRVRCGYVGGVGLSLEAASAITASAPGREMVMGPITVRRHEKFEPPLVRKRKPVHEREPIHQLTLLSGGTSSLECREATLHAPRVRRHIVEGLGTFSDIGPAESFLFLIDCANEAREEGLVDTPKPYDRSLRAALPSAHMLIPDPQVHGIAWRGLPGLELTVAPPGLRALGTLSLTSRALLAEPLITEYPDRVVDGDWRVAAGPLELRLLPGDRASSFGRWSNRLTVWMPPGESQLVVFSSALKREHIETHQAGYDATLPAAPPDALDQLLKGAVGSVTGFSTLLLTHAVPKPVDAPRIVSHQVERKLGQAEACIELELGIHRGSTGNWSVDAEWEEIEDDPSQIPMSWMRKRLNDSPRGATAIKDRPDLLVAPSPDDGKEPIEFLHRFADTRRRIVRYTVKAVGRYREWFPDCDEEACSKRSRVVEIDIPSSGIPQPIDFEFAIQRKRVENIGGQPTQGHLTKSYVAQVRLFFRRPAFSTGEGEMLGVVLAPNGTPTRYSEAVSMYGGDPLFVTRAPDDPGLREDFFPDPDLPRMVVPVIERENGQTRTDPSGAPIVSTSNVSVIGYALKPAPDRDLVYADVTIARPPFWRPFVRLAIVRFQPHSVSGAHISEVRYADFVQLLPDRTATMKLEAWRPSGQATLRVTVTGRAPFQLDTNEQPAMMVNVRAYHARSKRLLATFPCQPSWLSKEEALASWTTTIPVKASPGYYGPHNTADPFPRLVLLVEEIAILSSGEVGLEYQDGEERREGELHLPVHGWVLDD